MDSLALFKALSDATRLRIVVLLAASECTVQELTGILEMGQSRISRHLKILVESGALKVRRQGTWGYYRTVTDHPLFAVLLPALLREQGDIPGSRQDRERLAQVLEERRQRSLQFFDRHARQWDAMAENLLPLADYRMSLLAEIPDCQTLIDVGVGTGGLLEDLIRLSVRVIGVDQSPAMLAEAKARLRREGFVDKVDLRLGEMSHLPLPDSGADAVVLNMVLHHAADPPSVFRELGRVLRGGGEMIVADLERHDLEWTRESLADQWLGFSREEIEKWLTGAGFDRYTYSHFGSPPKELVVFVLHAWKRGEEESATTGKTKFNEEMK